MGKAEVLIKTDTDLAIAIRNSLVPDDKNPPPGFKLRSCVREGVFSYFIEFSHSKHFLLTLLSIIDEVSRFAELIENTVKAINEAYKPRHTT